MDTQKLPDPVTVSQMVDTVVDAFITILSAIEGHPFAAVVLLLALIGVVLWAWRPRRTDASALLVRTPPGTVITVEVRKRR